MYFACYGSVRIWKFKNCLVLIFTNKNAASLSTKKPATKLDRIKMFAVGKIVYLNTDSLLVDRKLTVWSFFHDLFVLEYANSSNQCDLFFSRFTCSTNMSNQICRIRVTPKTVRNKSKVFIFNNQYSSLFLRTSVSSLLNKESMFSQIDDLSDCCPLDFKPSKLMECSLFPHES